MSPVFQGAAPVKQERHIHDLMYCVARGNQKARRKLVEFHLKEGASHYKDREIARSFVVDHYKLATPHELCTVLMNGGQTAQFMTKNISGIEYTGRPDEWWYLSTRLLIAWSEKKNQGCKPCPAKYFINPPKVLSLPLTSHT
jgi:hypothetical protein